MKKTIGLLLTICLVFTMFAAVIPIANASNAYVINGVTVHYDDFTSSPNECWAYANKVYYKIWRQQFTSSFGSSDNYLRNLSDADLTLTAAHLKSYVSNAALGSCLRICNSEYLHGNDGWGHSQIIVQKDANGFTVFEGGLTAAPYCREKYYTWSEYINTGGLGGTYSYIKYIKWPGSTPYIGSDTITPGKPALKNFTRSYAHGATTTFTWDSTVNTTHYNLYVDRRASDGTWERTYTWHYAESGFSYSFPDGIYEVLLQSTNANADGWPYTDGDWLTFVVGPHTHDRGAYLFYEAAHPHCNCYECSVCGTVWRDTSSSNYMDSCLECHRPDKPVITGVSSQYIEQQTITIRWTAGANTTHCNYWLQKKNGNGEWETKHKIDYASSPVTETLSAGEYRTFIVATNSNYWEEDGSTWMWIDSDYVYFTVKHKYVDTITPPTCTAQGYTTHTCSICGDSYRDSYTNALGHAWNNGVITKPATATEDGVRTYTCTRCGATRTEAIPRTGLTNPFVDVKEGKYYYNAVLWAYYHDPQVTGGTDATHFSPNKTCTREQIVTFLWKACGAPEPTTTSNPFKDVKSTKYYYKAVLWAVENGITGGVGDGKFGVGQPCTREQAMTFLWKACGSPEPTSTSNPFADVKRGKYFYQAVLWAVENNITSGTSATTFGVGQTCTRGQIVTFLYKAMEN